MGRLDGSLPQVVYPESEILCKRQWRHSQVLSDHFWSSYIRHYLPSLQVRQKWHTSPADLKENVVVMLVDPQLPRALWPIGRVIKVHTSADGHVRSAEVEIKAKMAATLPEMVSHAASRHEMAGRITQARWPAHMSRSDADALSSSACLPSVPSFTFGSNLLPLACPEALFPRSAPRRPLRLALSNLLG
ncbi:hypothetical protein DPEC_G00217400 [Dallia pectoralis]|uniref:Uncharacterized protein n=1 Tax=Dallia pectoralis TaxID=75939 RepID=A0ACC2G2Z0_DALPE|nr:hypothetical protein DPEC_G00217400 [Dallia pectoralis]